MQSIFRGEGARFTAVDRSKILFIGDAKSWNQFQMLAREFDQKRPQFRVEMRIQSYQSSKSSGLVVGRSEARQEQLSTQIFQAGSPSEIALREQEAIDFQDFLVIREKVDALRLVLNPVGQQVELRIEAETRLMNGQQAVLSQKRLVPLNQWVELSWNNESGHLKDREVSSQGFTYQKQKSSFSFHRMISIERME